MKPTRKLPLSLREAIILKLSLNGFQDREIAPALNLSSTGVKILREGGFKKLAEREREDQQ
jgi:DNA-binding CsgD family transcriptional regulator